MRLILVVSVLMFLAPLAQANAVTGRAFGAYACAPSAGGTQQGLAQIYFARASVTSSQTISLDWTLFLGVHGDYDLWLFKPGAADDGQLAESEILAFSDSHLSSNSHEAVTWTFTAGENYVVVVVPFQAQGQAYTLGSDGLYMQYGAEESFSTLSVQTGAPAPWDQTFVGDCPA